MALGLQFHQDQVGQSEGPAVVEQKGQPIVLTKLLLAEDNQIVRKKIKPLDGFLAALSVNNNIYCWAGDSAVGSQYKSLHRANGSQEQAITQGGKEIVRTG